MINNRHKFIIHICRVLNILLPVLFYLPFKSLGQEAVRGKSILLSNELHKFTVDGYRIAEINAEPGGNEYVGKMISESKQTEMLYFKDGTDKAIREFLSANYISSDPAKQVRFDIKELLVTESVEDANKIKGNVGVQFGFDIIKGDSLYAHLTNYKGNITYTRSLGQNNVTTQYLKQGIENGLQYFNNWFLKNRVANSFLANKVKLVITDYKEAPEGDTIYYDSKRPLKWTDFQDHLRHNGAYSAEVIPGLGFSESNHVKDGSIIVELKLKVYLPKSAAWVKPGEENEYNLNHEQRHFDIVEIVAKRLRKKLASMELPVFNYDGDINVAYFDALRELTALQKQYDLETAHGSDAAGQQKWNKKIDEELNDNLSGSQLLIYFIKQHTDIEWLR